MGSEMCIRDSLVRECGVDLNARNILERTALDLASENGQTETVIALVRDCCADVTARDKFRQTALHLASERGQLRTVSILVKRPDIQLNAKNREEQTPLDVAETNILVSSVIRTALLAGADEEDTEKLKQKLLQDLPRLNRYCLLYTSPSPRDLSTSRMPSSA